MKGRKTWERGYAAGLIDGEGCIQIKRVGNNGKSRNPEYNLQVSINMTDEEPLKFMLGCFGGSIYHTKQHGYGFREVYRWEITRKPAEKFLKQILSFLKNKKKQAELGIRFQQQRITQTHAHGKYQPFPQYVLDKYHSFYEEMRKLKSPVAGATTKRIGVQMNEAIV